MRRYKKFGTVIDTEEFGKVQLGLPFGMDILFGPRIVEYTISMEEEGRPDLVAWKVLGEFNSWELICDRNGIDDPLMQFNAGKKIVIPMDPVSDRDIRALTYQGTE